MKSPWIVIEIFEDTASQAFLCEDYDKAVDLFKNLVLEYGVEPYEEMINKNIFMTDDGYVVQMLIAS
jgi:hypothetical protein